MHSDNIELAR